MLVTDRQTLNPSVLKVSDPSKPERIHTSCRSESSNISLVDLDNERDNLKNGNRPNGQTWLPIKNVENHKESL